MARVTRFDRGDLKKAERTPQGYLRAPAIATRTGILTYRNGDGAIRRELRHPDDVFAPESLATLAGVPVTDDHPNVKNPNVALLTPDNTKDFMIGYTGDDVGREDDKFVTAVVTVTDSRVIAEVEGGKSEVSCGYTCEHEEVPGTYDGQAYDIRQRNIVYNHLAIVDRGRAGPDVRLRLDAADAEQVPESYKPSEDKRMEPITLSGVVYQVSPELKAAIEKAMASAKDPAKVDDKGGDTTNVVTSPNGDPSKAKADDPKDGDGDNDMQKKMDRAQARADAAEAELKRAKAERADAAPEAVRKAARERVKLEKVAARVLDKEAVAKLDSMDDLAVKIAVIKAEHKGAILDGKSTAYIEARFDAVVEGLDAGDAATKDIGKELGGARADAANKDGEPDAEAARKRMMERQSKRWQGATKAS